MRIVLDTNVLARTTPGPESPAREVLRLAAAQPHALLLSADILSELARVLRYGRLRQRHGLTDIEIDQHIANIEAAGVVVPLPAAPSLAVVPHDPDDDPVVATAVVGQANVLCTRDSHLLHLDVVTYCRSHSIEIMSDVELLRILREEAEEKSEP